MSSKENMMNIERARCIYCGRMFRTDEYGEICIFCKIKMDDGEKLTAKFEPDIIYFKNNFNPNFKSEKQKKYRTKEDLEAEYGKYEPLTEKPSLKHEKIELNCSHYFLGTYIPTYKNPDLFSKKIYPRFKSVYKYVYEPEAKEFAKYLINGIESYELDFDVVVPVPSSSGMVKRGQSRLTDILSEELDIDYGVDILKRVTKIRKSKCSGSDRPSIQEHLVSLSCDGMVSGERVLLLDDVYTSGNTVKSCFRILKNNKASDVKIVTLAKTIGW